MTADVPLLSERRPAPVPSASFSPGVVVGGVEAHMTNQLRMTWRRRPPRRGAPRWHGGAVQCHALGSQRWRGCGGAFIGRELEPDARGADRLAVAVDEHPLVWRSRLSLQQLFQQHHGFRPERGRCVPCVPCQTGARSWACRTGWPRDTGRAPPVSMCRCCGRTRATHDCACFRVVERSGWARIAAISGGSR